jgi:hypothetical protein
VPFGPGAERAGGRESDAMPARSSSSDGSGGASDRGERTNKSLTGQPPVSQLPPSRARTRVVELAPPLPPSAQDFWTGAAGVQDVLQGPDVVGPDAPITGRMSAEVGGLRRRARRGVVGAARRLRTNSSVLVRARIARPATRVAWVRFARPKVLVACASLLVVAGAVEAVLVKDASSPSARPLAQRPATTLSHEDHTATASRAALAPRAGHAARARHATRLGRTHRHAAAVGSGAGQSTAAAPANTATPVSCCAGQATQTGSTAVDYARQPTATQAAAGSRASAPPAGPTGRVSLVGAGTTPSG